MDPSVLLILMLAAYAIPIGVVYFKYRASDSGSRSISSIITSQDPFFVTAAPETTTVFLFQTRNFIAACMLLMAGFTIAYEYPRPRWSLFAIIAVLIGIFGVIFIPEHEPTHYLFGATVFFAILGFMVGHTYYGTADADADADTDAYGTLRILLYTQFLFMILTVIGVIQDTPIFTVEALFILNFAVFYLYLHHIYYTFSISTPPPPPSSST
jgi:hypothetical protein